MPTEKQIYAAELNAIAKRYGALEDDTIRHMLAMLRDLRKQIAGDLTTARDWSALHLRALQASVDARIQQFEAQLNAELSQALQQAIMDGSAEVVQPMLSAGLGYAFATITPAQLNVVTDFTSRLVQQIGDDLRAKIDMQIRLAVLGNKSPLEAMRGITQALGTKAEYARFKGRPPVTKGVAARAETILRTEMQRANNLATYSQQQLSARTIPGLTKSWMATGDSRTRPSHLRAHIQYKREPIPIDEPFIIGPSHSKMMYPLDPNGAVEEIISCRCRSVTHHPAIGRVGSSLDGRIAAELKRRTA